MDAPSDKEQIQMRQAELARREQALARNASPGHTTAAPPPKKRFKALLDVEQQVVLINIANTKQRPMNERPAYRVLGVFPNAEKATSHARSIVSQVGDSAIHLVEIGKKVLLCESFEKQYDGAYCNAKVGLMTEKLLRSRPARDEEFEVSKAEKKASLTQQQQPPSKRKTTTTREAAIKHVMDQRTARPNVPSTLPVPALGGPITLARPNQDASDVSPACMIRNQVSIVVSAVKDEFNTSSPEPVVIFWRAFSNKDEAIDYVRDTASHEVRDLHLDVVDMYEWQFPQDVKEDELPEQYRNAELNTIMNRRKTTKDDVKEFESWCGESKVKPRVTEMIADIETGDVHVNHPGELADLTAYETIGPKAVEPSVEPSDMFERMVRPDQIKIDDEKVIRRRDPDQDKFVTKLGDDLFKI